VDAFIAGRAGDEAAAAAVTVARQVRDQVVDLTGAAPALRRGVARDRRISVGGDMRHGANPDRCYPAATSGTSCATWTPGWCPPWASRRQRPEGQRYRRHHGRPGRGRVHLVRAAHRPGLPVLGPGPRPRPGPGHLLQGLRVRNAGGRPAKDQFTLDFTAGRLTCPAGVAMPFEPGQTVRYRAGTCAACPLHYQQPRAQRCHPPRSGAAG